MKSPGILILPALLFSFSLFLQAQPTTFVRMYGNGNCGFSVRENNNAYVVAGGTDFYYNYHWHMLSVPASTNFHLFATNTSGILAWEKIYSMTGYRTLARWIEPTLDGGYILCGSRNADVTWPPDSNDVVVMKTNSTGVIQWSKVYDSGKDELGFCIRPTLDGGYIVAGFHDSIPVSLAGSTFLLLIKTDALGNITWVKKYPIAVRDFDTGEALPCAIRQTADSGYVVTGTTSGAHQADIFVLCTDPGGNLLWAKSYEHAPSDFRLSTGADVIECSSGEILVAGSMDKDRTLFQFNYPFLLRLSSAGLLLDAGIYDSNPASMFQSGFSSVEQTPDGGFLFTGMGGYGGFGDQAQLLKTNAALAQQWSRVYTFDGMATLGARSAQHTTDGGYVFTGKHQMDGTILMKTGPTGLIPCKNPGTLFKILPAMNIVSRTPVPVSGMNTFPALFNTLPALNDTTSLCPEQSFPLPVEMLALQATAKDQEVVINWKTATEFNNDFFDVERSADGIEFVSVGKIDGAGTTTLPHAYEFRDAFPVPGNVSYYRLRQVDYDGASHYSEAVAALRRANTLSILSILAGPGSIELSFLAPDEDEIHLTLVDVLGRVAGQQSVAATKGINKISLPLHTPAQGIYFLILRQKSCTKNIKIDLGLCASAPLR